MIRKSSLLSFALVSGAVFSAAVFSIGAQAATGTTNLDVTATVADNCTIATVALTFGAYDPIVTNATLPLVGTGTVTVKCTTGATASVTLGESAVPAGGSTPAAPARQMTLDGTALGTPLTYALYQSAGTLTPWDNVTGQVAIADGAANSLTVYGIVDPGQLIPTGSYSDVIVATVTF